MSVMASPRELLDELREQDVHLKVDGLMLQIDAPEMVLSDELLSGLRENKRTIIRHLEAERVRLEEASRRGLIIRWAKESGYVTIHDPTTGEWHEVPASGCPPWVVEDAKSYHRRNRIRA